jgi:hypothetical protein
MPLRSLLNACGPALVAALLLPGCTPTPPPITNVEGVVLLNDAPLPNALVEFAPELTHFGAEMNSTGITDDKGFFRLTCAFKSQPGAAVGKHRVVITDAPAPAEARGPSQAAQERLTKFMNGLKNRPIPTAYGAIGTTPLIVEVTPEQKSYTLKLTRDK